MIFLYSLEEDFTYLDDHKDKHLILSEIEEIRLIASLHGYGNYFFSVGVSPSSSSEYFIFKNTEGYSLNISFDNFRDGNFVLTITYPICLFSKVQGINGIYGVKHRVEKQEDYLDAIKQIKFIF